MNILLHSKAKFVLKNIILERMQQHKDTNKIILSNENLQNIQMEQMIQFGLHKSRGDVKT